MGRALGVVAFLGLFGGCSSSASTSDGPVGATADAPVAKADAPLAPMPDGGATTGVAFPVGISTDKRHLVDAHGSPFLIRGDSAWSLIAQLDTAGAVTYLDDRKARGFNTVLVNLIEHQFSGHTPPWKNAAGDVPFTDTQDFTTTVDAYFDHARAVVDAARDRGFVVLLVPAYLGYGCGAEGWCSEMQANGVDKLHAYGQLIGGRFADAPNVIWVEGGDDTPDGSARDLVEAVAQGILAGDGGAHLQTAHWASETAGADVATTWLDLDSLYSYTTPHSYVEAKRLAARDTGVRPFFLIESSYENEHSTTPLELRAQMYQPVLAGGTGFLFGNFPIWALWVPGNPPWFLDDGGYPGGWTTALGSPGAHDATVAGDVLASLRWSELRPDTAHAIMTSGFGSEGSDGYALCAGTADGTLAVAYYTARLSAVVDMSRFAGPVRARWLDPSSGSFSAIAGSPFAASGTQTFRPAATNGDGSADWLLVLDVP